MPDLGEILKGALSLKLGPRGRGEARSALMSSKGAADRFSARAQGLPEPTEPECVEGAPHTPNLQRLIKQRRSSPKRNAERNPGYPPTPRLWP